MTIIRIVALDPAPREDCHGELAELITWQVPENSRAHELLIELLFGRGIEYDLIEFRRKPKDIEPPVDYPQTEAAILVKDYIGDSAELQILEDIYLGILNEDKN